MGDAAGVCRCGISGQDWRGHAMPRSRAYARIWWEVRIALTQVFDGPKAKNLSDLSWLLRPRDCGAVDEGGLGGLGCGKQSFPSGCRQEKRRPRGHRCDDVEA